MNIRRYQFFKFSKFIIFTLIIAVFILSPIIAQANSQPGPIELKEGWKYRFGDSPLTSSGIPSRISEDISSKDWKDIVIKSPCLERDKNFNCVWFSIVLPQSQWTETDLYFPYIAADSYDVFLENNLIYSYRAVPFELKDFSINFQRLLIPLPNDFSEKKLSLRVYSNYSNVGPSVSVFLGSHYDLIRLNISNDLDNLILGFLFLVLGIIMLPIIVFLKSNERKSLLTLLMVSSTLGIWMLEQYFELNQIVHLNRTILHFIFTTSLFLFLIFILYFFEQLFGLGYKSSIKIIRIFQVLFLFVFIIMFLINTFCNVNLYYIIDFLLNIPFYLSGCIALLILLATIITSAVKGDIDAKIFMYGFAIFAFFICLDGILISMRIGYYKPYFTKWSMLIFVASLVLILGRRFFDAHRKLIIYSNELESKNETLNNMWLEIKSAKDEVDHLNSTLEQRVDERTEELEATLDTLLHTQAQLIQAEKMAALGGLVAGISHEINTPVGIGVTAASHLEKESREIANLHTQNKMKRSDFEKYMILCTESTGMILSNLKRASELIKSFKKVAVDQSNEHTREFNLKEYIEEIILSLSPTLKKTKLNVTLNCSDDIILDSYPGAISQIVTNLIMNSLTHAFDSNDCGNILIDVSRKNDSVYFNYSDDGKGISKDNIAKIFDPFFTTKRNKGGTGLGLNIIYNLVTKTLRGTINCESEEGHGTAFVIEFPA